MGDGTYKTSNFGDPNDVFGLNSGLGDFLK